MKHLLTILAIYLVAACASKPPPPAAQAETTAAPLPAEAYNPPGQWEMTIADGTEAKKKDAPPPLQGQADTTANKRQSGALITLPSNSKPGTK
jgi:hypothetical protein